MLSFIRVAAAVVRALRRWRWYVWWIQKNFAFISLTFFSQFSVSRSNLPPLEQDALMFNFCVVLFYLQFNECNPRPPPVGAVLEKRSRTTTTMKLVGKRTFFLLVWLRRCDLCDSSKTIQIPRKLEARLMLKGKCEWIWMIARTTMCTVVAARFGALLLTAVLSTFADVHRHRNKCRLKLILHFCALRSSLDELDFPWFLSKASNDHREGVVPRVVFIHTTFLSWMETLFVKGYSVLWLSCWTCWMRSHTVFVCRSRVSCCYACCVLC